MLIGRGGVPIRRVVPVNKSDKVRQAVNFLKKRILSAICPKYFGKDAGESDFHKTYRYDEILSWITGAVDKELVYRSGAAHAVRSRYMKMDMQTAVLGMLPDSSAFVANVAKAIAGARDKKLAPPTGTTA